MRKIDLSIYNKEQKISIMYDLSKKIYDKFLKLTNDKKIAESQSKMFLNEETAHELYIDDSITAQVRYLNKKKYDMEKIYDFAYLTIQEYNNKYNYPYYD